MADHRTVQAGVYPLWGSYYIRWWLASGLQRLFDAGGFIGTPLMPVYYRLMGAKVGRGCALDSALVSAWDLVSIGDDTSIGPDTQLHGARVENGYLVIGRVDIGSRCFVGAHSALGLDVRMGDDSRLDDQSLLPDGATLAAGEQRSGSPAKASRVAGAGRADLLKPRCDGNSPSSRFHGSSTAWSAWSSLAPGLAVLWLWLLAFRHGLIWLAIWATAALAPVFVVVTCLWIAGLKAILLRRAKPGVYPLYSFYYLRNWLAYGLMRSSRAMLLPIFTTIYLPPWMRLLGAKVGKHAEMSTVWSFMPELLDAGDSAFFADGCMLGGRRVFGGRFQIAINRVGNRSFVGNGAILPTGAGLGDGCLLGVLSAPPYFRADDARRHRLARFAGISIAQSPEGSGLQRRGHLSAEPQALRPARRGRRAAHPHPAPTPASSSASRDWRRFSTVMKSTAWRSLSRFCRRSESWPPRSPSGSWSGSNGRSWAASGR